MDRAASATDDLADSARRGESWALTQIWHRYSPSVLGYLRGRNVVDAEDVTSEVFLQVFQRIERFKGGEADLRTFIFSVAHARYVDEVRRTARRGTSVEYDPAQHDSVVASAETEALRLESTERALALIEGLSPDQRDVLLLRIVADLSLEQTAAVLDKKVGAIKALQHRALAALRPIVEAGVSK
ncbi:MAG: sigma-70 family RNA polymerase sigma factor [Frankiaceae bacterium]|nr:sigma-70 family RNA polymerase sigma factor [Frankiaceae bacterium]